MLRKRVIVCLDVRDGRMVKRAGLKDLRDAGDPAELAARYEADGADEIVFLDGSASAEGRRTLVELVTRTAETLSIPLTVGGGIHEVADVALLLRAGADKVSINTAAIKRPELIGEAAVRFGKQCVVAGINARVEKRQIELVARTEGTPVPGGSAQQQTTPSMAPLTDTWFRVFADDGRTATELDAISWAKQCAALGAGEILAASIDQDGQRQGYDLEFIARVVEAVAVPVIASGGAGSAEHMRDVFLLAGADAASASSIFHDGVTTIRGVKGVLATAGIPIREIEDSPPAV